MSVTWEEYLPDLTPLSEAELDLVEVRRRLLLPGCHRAVVRWHVEAHVSSI